jgi:hypothetical protein
MPSPLRKKSHAVGNARGFSAAAFAGVTGYPEARRNARKGELGLRALCAQFDRAFTERFLPPRPELRARLAPTP